MEEKLKYCIKGTDTFVQFAESPAGTYYLNVDKRLVIFIASVDMSNEDAYNVDGFMAIIGAASNVENAREIKRIHDTFIRLDVGKDWDPDTPVTYKIEGEMVPIVSGKPGTLYIDMENKKWYFKPTIKTLRSKLLDLFKESIARHAKISSRIKSILVVLETWEELDDDKIISD